MQLKRYYISLLILCAAGQLSCQDDDKKAPVVDEKTDFYFGADLSYVNQILDHGGVYKDDGEIRSPYKIFGDNGANLIRLRLWHNPTWTKEVYGASGTQLYNNLADVEKSIRLAKEQGMSVLLDFHYSDTWADPGKQEIPKAWQQITELSVLKDSVYQYTFKTLAYLDDKGLMPELVQIGNETNCGMLYTNAAAGFPSCNVCNESTVAAVRTGDQQRYQSRGRCHCCFCDKN
jgi:arabinogalactan endo-1,4-beta-galactosidase